MKKAKAWEALKAFQEEGRLCRPVDRIIPDQEFDEPKNWKAHLFLADREFELEPPKPQVVEFVFDYRPSEKVLWNDEVRNKLHGKRWRCVCTEIVEEE